MKGEAGAGRGGLFRTSLRVFLVTFAVCGISAWLLFAVLGPAFGFSDTYGLPNHDGYLEIARTLTTAGRFALEPDGPPVLHRPPAYPLLLAAIHLTLGPGRLALCLAQALLAGLMAVVAFRFARRHLGAGVAGWLPLAILLYPWLYWHVKNPMTPILLALLYWLFAVAWATARRANGAPAWLATGAFGGLLSLTHGGTLLLLPLAVAIGVVESLLRRRVRSALVPLVAFAPGVLLIAPWTARNYAVTGRIVPVNTNAGFTYFWGLAIAERSLGSDVPNPRQRAFELAGIDGDEAQLVHAAGVIDAELDARFNQRFRQRLLGHPGETAAKALIGAVWYWFPLSLAPESVALWVINGLVLGLAGIGLGRAAARGAPVVAPLTCVLYSWGVHAVIIATVGHAQYSFSSVLLLLPYAVLGACALASGRPEAGVAGAGELP